MSSTKYNYNKLADKHVLILGATSGLGFAVAKACLAQSARITISSSSSRRIEKTIQTLISEFPDATDSVKGYSCDLSRDSAEDEIETLFSQVGVVDHIVYTAADALSLMPLQDITRERIIAGAQIRLIAPILVAKIGCRYLTPGPESSFTLTSGGISERPSENWTIVAAIMGGVNSVMRNLALELKPIRVNAVSPGLVDTEMWDATFEKEAKDVAFRALGEKHLTGRVASADEVAEAYVYLMKDSNVTGRVISSDSGSGIV
ncbi:oxidoreductase [Penicillium angulare]|uniref:Oxidoreductase n=1 Tax=Penicillium angulare TaxID=116970 RepID=A0A9W9KRJ9_9EURO|nr:oxidoreductase [Penicillium angulare]